MRTKTAKKNNIPKARAITNDPYVVWLFSLVFLTFRGMEVVETGKDKQQQYNNALHTQNPSFHIFTYWYFPLLFGENTKFLDN